MSTDETSVRGNAFSAAIAPFQGASDCLRFRRAALACPTLSNRRPVGARRLRSSAGNRASRERRQGCLRPREKLPFDFAVFFAVFAVPDKKSVPAKRVAGTLFFKLQALNFKFFSPYFFGIAGRDAAAIAWPWRLDFSSGTTRLIFSSGNSALRTSFALSMMIVPPSPEVTRPMMSRFS